MQIKNWKSLIQRNLIKGVNKWYELYRDLMQIKIIINKLVSWLSISNSSNKKIHNDIVEIFSWKLDQMKKTEIGLIL